VDQQTYSWGETQVEKGLFEESLCSLRKLRWVRLVVIIILLVMSLFPVYWAVSTSLRSRVAAFELPPEWIFKPTLSAYKLVVDEQDWGHAYLNSVIIAIGSVAIGLSAGTLAAYAVTKIRRDIRTFMLFLIILTRMIPPVVTGIPFFTIFRKYGLLDQHVPLMFVYATIHLPYVIWMMQGFFADIPVELEEAAQIDGANRLTALTKIILPLSLPGMVATALFCIIISWNEFFYALILTRFRAVTIQVVVAGFLKIYTIEWAQMCAAAVLVIVPVIIFSFLVQKHLAQGLAGGAIKG